MGNVRRRVNWWSRTLHRWGAIGTLAPVAVIAATGVVLQLKKQWSWIQPATAEGVGGAPLVSFDRVLEAARGAPEAGIVGWEDVDRVDYRPREGVAKVRGRSRWEVQVDTATGEALHDGSFFGDGVKTWVFLPTGVVLIVLWGTGAWLWAMPWVGRRRRQRES